jgi:hypothetical protein
MNIVRARALPQILTRPTAPPSPKQVARIALGRCGSFSYDQRAGDRRLVGDVHALGKNLNFLKLCL